MIVLNKIVRNARRGKLLRLPGFQKESSSVAKDLRLDQNDILNRRILKFHGAMRITATPVP
jgi:hypothetical protein